ncbi:MAG: phosphatidylserine decarboxylase family protein [Bacteroidales bacterium]|nr:phosphatidylserine decarboxylase family protein [Bacteroidales bacterium]
MRIRIHREGWDLLVLSLLLLIVLDLLLWFKTSPVVFYSVFSSTSIIYLLLVNFFRCPRRIYTGETQNMVISPCDGKVVVIEEVYEPEYFQDKRLQVSIFMSPLNVHANWYPANGIVKYVTHHEGRFQGAYLPKSSTENERSTIVIETEEGVKILVRQVAGALARRIVTYSDIDDICRINEFLGFIKFGSRLDLYFPLGTDVLVELEQKVTGNLTQIAKLK